MKAAIPIEELLKVEYGRLRIVSFSHSHNGRNYNCICICGKTKVVNVRYLRSGTVRSCGCLRKRIAISEGY